jgi:biotin-dependent carboxylase-like uncharacterized protein
VRDVLRCGLTGALVELDDREHVVGLYAALRQSPSDGVGEIVPGARTLLVRFDPRRTTFARVAEAVVRLRWGRTVNRVEDGLVRAPRRPMDDFRADLWVARRPCVEVRAPGRSATIQDLGRPGLAELGVGTSGAADQPSFRLANRLVGNPESYAAIEMTFGGLWVRFSRPVLIAITGAPCPFTVNGRLASMYAAVHVAGGAEICLGPPVRGLRSYLAVRGGIGVLPVLGSRSADTLAGLGPAPLAPGSTLVIGKSPLDYPSVGLVPRPTYPDQPVLRVIPGPRHDWLVDDALATLCDPGGYQVSSQCNRIGARLTGPVLGHRAARELPPEPLVTGALQVPPSGQPILFLADHPVTGGYPVIGVVHDDDLPLAAQARPGQRIRFTLDRQHRSRERTPAVDVDREIGTQPFTGTR